MSEADLPALHAPVLSRGTLLTRDIDRLAAFAERELGPEAVRLGDQGLALRDRVTGEDGRPYWVLEARLADEIEVPQTALNHWGLTVDTSAKVDEAYERLKSLKEEFGLRHVQKPREQHGSYSFYASDADSNWWEVEYRAPGARYEDLVDIAPRECVA